MVNVIDPLLHLTSCKSEEKNRYTQEIIVETFIRVTFENIQSW